MISPRERYILNADIIPNLQIYAMWIWRSYVPFAAIKGGIKNERNAET